MKELGFGKSLLLILLGLLSSSQLPFGRYVEYLSGSSNDEIEEIWSTSIDELQSPVIQRSGAGDVESGEGGSMLTEIAEEELGGESIVGCREVEGGEWEGVRGVHWEREVSQGASSPPHSHIPPNGVVNWVGRGKCGHRPTRILSNTPILLSDGAELEKGLGHFQREEDIRPCRVSLQGSSLTT